MRFHLVLSDYFRSETKLKIVKFLLDHTAAMSEREIASILKISHMSVNRTMRELNGVNLVSYVAVGNAHLWKVNRQSYAYGMLSGLIQQVKGIQDPVEVLKTLILKNLSLRSIKKIVLFGSIADKAEKNDSDIDLFILVKKNENKKAFETALDKLSIECLEKFGNRLAPYTLTEQEFSQKRDLSVIAAINKGIQLYPKQKG